MVFHTAQVALFVVPGVLLLGRKRRLVASGLVVGISIYVLTMAAYPLFQLDERLETRHLDVA